MKSQWSRDSLLTVDYVNIGTSVHTNSDSKLAVYLDGNVTDFFFLNATAAEVKLALVQTGVITSSEIAVERSELNSNGLHEWTVTFLHPEKGMPFLDSFYAMELAVDVSQISPAQARAFPTFEWLHTPPAHVILNLYYPATTSSSVCTLISTTVNEHVTLSNNKVSIQDAFDSIKETIGQVKVLDVDKSSDNFHIVFGYLEGPISLNCSNGVAATIIQSGNLVRADGSLVLSYDDKRIEVAANALDIEVETAINAVIDGGAVVVTKENTSNVTTWKVTFTDIQGAVPLLTVDFSELIGTNVGVDVQNIVNGSCPSGSIELSVDSDVSIFLDVTSTPMEISTALRKR